MSARKELVAAESKDIRFDSLIVKLQSFILTDNQTTADTGDFLLDSRN